MGSGATRLAARTKLNPGSKLRLKAWLWAARLAELASLKKN